MAKLGPPLRLTNKQIEELSIVTEDDVQRVNETWQKVVPSIIKNLLLAEKTDGKND